MSFSIYGLIIGISIILGTNFFLEQKNGLNQSQKHKIIFFTVFFSIIGARLYHVLDQYHYYAANPNQIFNLPNGGLGIFGALATGLITLLFFSYIYKHSLISLLDSITPILPLCQSIGRIGNYFNHETYSATGLPIWLYESILNLILFFAIKFTPSYSPTGMYFLGYGVIRFFTEYLRNDTWVINQIKIGQVISLVFIIFGFLLIYHLNTKNRKNSLYHKHK